MMNRKIDSAVSHKSFSAGTGEYVTRRSGRSVVAVALLSVAGALSLAGAAVAHGQTSQTAQDPVVAVTGGQVRGRLLPDHVAVYKGIPFAAPPVGDLRWREPQPVKPWQGVRDASAFSAACVQTKTKSIPVTSEDCLYLNVWAPAETSATKKPVYFWVYGGANIGGSADSRDGAFLSRRGVVVVTLNYRAGIFGYFAHPELASESSHHSAGDYGLLDLLAGLKWVHENIARFGGDPDNVTIGGQSSGSSNVSYLLTSPLTAGLFQRAIQESGTGNPPQSLQKTEQQGTKFAEFLKAPAGQSQLKFLRNIPADALLKATHEAPPASAPTIGPSLDGWFMPIWSKTAFAEGKENRASLLIGSNSRERGLNEPYPVQGQRDFSGPSDAVREYFGVTADKALAYYGLNNGGSGHADPLFGPVDWQIAADGRQRCSSIQEGIWHTAKGNQVYEYDFDRPSPGQSATAHGAELAFIWGDEGSPQHASFSEQDRKFSEIMQTYWVNFIKTGDPNGAALPVWPKFDANRRAYLEFQADGSVVSKSNLRREICDIYMENVLHEINPAAH